ncbi:acyl dehydratase [Xanthobacter flavus]|uniref:Acyl dehydratase n=1 Tax=Xanthobacter flavus TaxID=281 RepID=A0A9W6CHR3_XANFL|nr:MaoC/PaaZ C-terminal domain-containing protein [Xanthobacter flavus]MDR6331653.1 acyl dehydratase [Xanthobacter flavus]GLI22556.1 acyl dehydratase [Xanthobacter flavus]
MQSRFDELAVGDRYTLSSDAVTTRQLVMYAGASGDFNRIHYDQAYAQEAGLSGVIAHGMLTMAIAGRSACAFGGPGVFVRDIEGRFLNPVRPGDVVVMTVEVVAKMTGQGGSCCDLALKGEVEGRLVFQGRATLTFQR